MPRFKLHNILHVPKIATNLLFVHQFTKDNDCTFLFYSNGFSIQDRVLRRTLFQRKSKNRLYHISYSPGVCKTDPTTFFGERTTVEIWHKRLGHPSQSVLHRVLPSLSIARPAMLFVCEFRQYAKRCKLSFTTSNPVTTFHLN